LRFLQIKDTLLVLELKELFSAGTPLRKFSMQELTKIFLLSIDDLNFI
jgi:hypothetical protein